MDIISGPTKKSWRQLRSGSETRTSGLMALEHHWSKCIILEGNYIKKEEIDLTQKKLGWFFIDSPSYQMPFNVEFDWYPDHLSDEPPVEGPPIPITTDMVKKAISQMKEGKALGPSGMVVIRAARDGAPP